MDPGQIEVLVNDTTFALNVPRQYVAHRRRHARVHEHTRTHAHARTHARRYHLTVELPAIDDKGVDAVFDTHTRQLTLLLPLVGPTPTCLALPALDQSNSCQSDISRRTVEASGSMTQDTARQAKTADLSALRVRFRKAS